LDWTEAQHRPKIRVFYIATYPAQEVAGYAEAMDLVLQAFEDLRITENHIRRLHQVLLKHSTKDERHRGDYKALPNHVVAFDENGQEIGTIFETASPFETPGDMESLIAWINKATNEDAMHPLLLIAVFVVVFLAIHPFQDGNGRLSRILTTLMLLRSGYAYVPYASLESVIEENKDLYYRALRRTQTTIRTETPDWDPWVGFFLRCLKKQKENLARRLDREPADQYSDSELPQLSVTILELLRKHNRLSISEIVKHSGANQNTLKVGLRELVKAGRVRRHGKGRATWYSL